MLECCRSPVDNTMSLLEEVADQCTANDLNGPGSRTKLFLILPILIFFFFFFFLGVMLQRLCVRVCMLLVVEHRVVKRLVLEVSALCEEKCLTAQAFIRLLANAFAADVSKWIPTRGAFVLAALLEQKGDSESHDTLKKALNPLLKLSVFFFFFFFF